MGGSGSGRWEGFQRKRRVEECLALDINYLIREGLFQRPYGKISWPDHGISFDYNFRTYDHPHWWYLRVFYEVRVNGKADRVSQPITVHARSQRIGGLRWWFFCPRWCHKYVTKLYLPKPDARYHIKASFGCRTCHSLTYRSVQEHDKRMDRLGRNPELLYAALKQGSLPGLRYILRTPLPEPPKNVGSIGS